jgi:cytochrome P450
VRELELLETDASEASLAERQAHWDPYWPADFDVLERARTRCPVSRSDAAGGYWMVTRHDNVQQVLQNPKVFSSADGITIPHNPAASIMPPIDLDPPLQRDFRHLLNPCLSPGALKRHADSIRRFADTLIDAFVADGCCEFMSAFARPLPALVLARVILQVDDVPTMIDLQHRLQVMATGNNSPEAPAAWAYLREFAETLLDGRRGQPPDDTVISALVHGRVEGRPLTEDEQLGTIMILLLGGLETTTHAFGNIAYHMTCDSSIEPRLRQIQWTVSDLDEFLRLDPPVQWIGRTVMEACELAGTKLEPGEKVMAHLASANRDSSVFEEAGSLRFGRPVNRHFAFGLGAHRCVGSHLARQELQIGFERLLSRTQDIQLASGATVGFSGGMGRGPVELPLAFKPLPT